METLLHDLRYSIRQLRRSPGFTAVAVLTLALGIGATTAIFSVVNAVLIRPLSYEDADRVVRVRGTFADKRREVGTISLPNFRDLQEQTSGAAGSSSVFEAMAAQHGWQPILLGGGEPERLQGASVTADWFRVLGVRPALGRFFLPQEDAPGASRSVVLSHGFWNRRFGADPAVLGQSLELGGELYTVVGVAPPFDDPGLRLSQPEIWRVSPSYFVEMGRGGRSFQGIARLGPGVRLERAQAEVDAVTRRLEAAYPEPNAKRGATLVPIKDEIVGSVRPALLILLVAVALVLLIACANVANLLFARATGQWREIAVRSALGASRGRVVRQLLTESALLALIGGAAGVGLAWWGTDLLLAFGGAELPRAGGIGVDGWVLAFAAVVSVLTGILFGIAPALLMSRAGLQPALKEGDAAGSGLLRKGLVAGQVALAVVVLVGAGLLIRSLWNLTRVDPGFRPAGVLTLETQLPSSERFEEVEAVAGLYARVLEGIHALPGVRSAEAVDRLPMGGHFNGLGFTIEGRPEPAPGEMPNAEARAVTPGYFETLGIPVLRGRGVRPEDRPGNPPVVVLNESLARRYWPGEDPIGERLARPDEGSWEVVGVVGDVREFRLSEAPIPGMYFPYAQAPQWMRTTSRFLIVRSADPLALTSAIREVIRSVEPTMVIRDVRTMDRVVSGTVAQPRFRTLLLALFAAVAAILGAVGIYGVVAHGVARRTHELAIRKALGARRDQIAGMVIRQGMIPVLAGLAIGIAGALAAGRVLASMLFGVGPADPLTFVAVAAVLLAAGLAASWLPARRATRVDPLVALKSE